MFNLDTVTTKNDDKNWPYRTLIIGTSESGKTNALLNLFKKIIMSLTRFICMQKI